MGQKHLSILLLITFVTAACVAQVRTTRVQPAMMQVDQPTEIALVEIDVPDWVQDGIAGEFRSPEELLAPALAGVMKGSKFSIVDKRNLDLHFPVGPKVAPIIHRTASSVALAGKPYAFDADQKATAYGAPTTSWKIVSAPPGFSLNESTGEVSWVPTQTGVEEFEIMATNEFGESSYQFNVEVKNKLDEELGLSREQKPNVGIEIPFKALFPAEAARKTNSPLILSVHVVGWNEGDIPYANTTRRRVDTDVVYTLWTRSGQEVETRRVMLGAQPQSNLRSTVPNMAPAWPVRLSEEWKGDREFVPNFAPLDQEKVAETVADLSARAFAFTYVDRKLVFSAQLKEEPGLEQGIALADKEDWEGAHAAFAEAAKTNPSLAGAHYNMGIMRALQGKTADAVSHLEKATQLDDSFLNRQMRDYFKDQLARQKKIEFENDTETSPVTETEEVAVESDEDSEE